MNDEPAIRTQLKQIIAHVSGLDPGRIADDAALRQDLNLDSLSLLEIAVDIDYKFTLGLADERYREVDSLPALVALVQERLAELGQNARAVER